MAEFEIRGLQELQKRLRDVSDEISVKGANFGARKAAQLVARAAWANALKVDDPTTGEQIAKNIWAGGAKYPGVRKKSKRSTPRGSVAYRVGVAGGARQYADTKENRRSQRVGKTYETLGDKSNPGGDTWYWRFIEFGTEKVRATPFLRPALEKNIQAATDVFLQEYEEGINRAVKRAQRRR